MLKRIDPNNIEELCSFLDGRMSDADPAILQRVSAILERVRNEGDEALFDYTKQFDQVEIVRGGIVAIESISMMER